MAQLEHIRLSGVTYDIIDATAVHSLDGYYTTGETNAAITAATDALAQAIAEQGYQTSGDVQTAISEAVSGKADSSAVTQEISAAVSGKADTTAVTAINDTLTAHTANTDIHVTSADKTAWNAKADIEDIPSVSGYADSVTYNSTSKYVEFYHGGTGGTKVFEYDASPFLIDGMVQNVEIKDVAGSGTCLVISFNTDAGKQNINIPISSIFDASNYYTKAQVDGELSGKTNNSTFTAYTASTATEIGNKADTTAMTQAISEATSGKADTTAVTQAISEATSGKADSSTVEGISNILTAHTANTTVHVTSSDKTTWNGKQDQLVSGTNIKTVGGESLLGSGNISFPAGLQVSVQDTTLVFG